MRKLMSALLLAATLVPAAAITAPAAAQSREELRRDRQDIRREQRQLDRAYARGDWREVRDQRDDVRDARREYREDRRDRREWQRGRNDWRNDWQGWRNDHRSLYARGGWRAPFRYQSFRPGVRIGAPYYGSRYVIADPWRYRLPAAPRSAQWVRHYDDVLLVDYRRGIVLDVIRGFYW